METTSTKIIHNLREPYDRSRGQVEDIIKLCDIIYEKTGKKISFDNEYANHYKLTLDNKEYTFTVYRDVIAALNLIVEFI